MHTLNDFMEQARIAARIPADEAAETTDVEDVDAYDALYEAVYDEVERATEAIGKMFALIEVVRYLPLDPKYADQKDRTKIITFHSRVGKDPVLADSPYWRLRATLPDVEYVPDTLQWQYLRDNQMHALTEAECAVVTSALEPWLYAAVRG
jgi:hypothetical protein